jgi:hypothetical protein
LNLRRDCSNEGIQRPSILVVVDVVVPNCFPHVANLEPYPHHHGPLDVVGLGEGRPPTAGTDVPDNGLGHAATMIPIRGGRAAPPVEAAIFVDSVTAAGSTVGVSTPVWAAAACALARSAVSASAPIWVAATRAPMGMRSCPLCRLLSRCFPRQPELFVGVVVDRSRAAAARAASATSAASTSALAAVSSAAASRAALAAVAAAAARSRSCAAATSASCWHRALEVTGRRDMVG